ncbi:HET-domain-containing protein [Trematosphaeria pertusa]|uniref:HET-domain-containing protein n=1 Tax=Trematosphaeria pertusa TaxID=390896 RepID=A0A6A6IFJ9_9PLEO|nr:HET-domain-containing protein [Trematosphaeria pertusa]KAF2248967.1 HET-domain-containing protein [Trematosphaeria pertusa]
MRLIDTSTLTLKEFPTSNQRYAILSHTWGADGEEVSYQDMTAHVVSEATKKKPGWRKIEKTCELARTHHGLQLAWIDTCCIDKRSSAELSEAINSMFRWYQEAETCFAFLSDVTWDPLNSLHQSRWFTRGWTLQELIAPKNVAFFNSDWTLFGTKASLTSELAFKTGIPRGILLHEITLDDVPVAARMSWASMRETTREEDLAYCLLGLFDIHMPMLYGEGRKAFLRLQEEIMRRTADMSIFLWTDPDSSRTYSGLLAETPAHFRYMQTVRIAEAETQRRTDFRP